MGVWLHANLIFGIGSGLLATLAVVMTHSVAWFCAGFAAGQLAALVYLHLRMRRSVPAPATSTWRDEILPLVRAAVPFAAAFFALTIFYKADVLLLARLRGAYDVGIYAAGYKIVDVLHALAVVGSGAVFPRLARGDTGGGARRTMELFLLLAVLASGSLWLLRAPLVDVLFGAAYLETAHALEFLAPAAAILTFNILAGYLLGVADRIELLGIAYAGASILKLLLGSMLMPATGAVGAATAMLISEMVLCVALLFALQAARVPLPRGRSIRLAAAAAIWALMSGVLLPAAAATILFLTGATALYVLGRALSAEEIMYVRHALMLGRAETAT
jgi:O-antigen/teichoic acid export membrane protein